MIIDFEIPEPLIPVFSSDKRNMVLYGGRGGGKSWIAAFFLICRAVKEEGLVILCTREIQNTIKDSVHSILVSIIEQLQLESRFTITKNEIISDMGSRFIFKGLYRNIQGIKSTEGIDYVWIEEAQTISQESIDLLWPTVRKPGSQFIITFNPAQENDPIYNRFITDDRPDTLKIKINYDENPFFPDVLMAEMEYDKEYNYNKYLHVWEGECKSITDACIFKGKFTVKDFKTPEGVHFLYGADWGFSNDPSCILRCFIDDGFLYIDQEAGGVGIEIEELPQLWDNIDGVRNNQVVADNARPETISFMKRKGFFVKPSKKGKDSIEEGIEFIRSFKMVYIHPRCKNVAYEFKAYSYKEDRLTGDILPIVVDKDNHYIDSLRYALEDARKGRLTPYSPTKIKLNQLMR